MTAPILVLPGDRAVLAIAGPDRATFLQGLVSNDVARAMQGTAIHAALLTPQGRFLHDFAIIPDGERLLVDTDAAGAEALRKRLSAYRLRSKATIEVLPGWGVALLLGKDAAAAAGLGADPGACAPFEGGVALVDPRLPALGVRLVLPPEGLAALSRHGWPASPPSAYEALRLSLGVPDGARDMADGLLLENGYDELRAIDWKKGCYVGQEVTARMRYRGLAKKRLVPVRIEGAPPAPGSVVTIGGEEAGEMRSAAGDRGLALLRLEAIEACARDGAALSCGEARLVPGRPAWLAPEG
ncbi:MAG: folate-binding protein YgfZ [Alphaproteobacteria bacterium]|nr:folate-binding protein YgfZ [Alphaproteobacteria bacterium]